MTTSTDNLLAELAAHPLTPDEMSWAQAGNSWALRADGLRMKHCADELSDEGLREAALAAELWAGMAWGTLKRRHSALPAGVEGTKVGSR